VAGWWTKVVNKVWDHLVLDEPSLKRSKEKAEPASVEEAVAKARAEWHAARLYFENVTDPELVDHAIYAIVAAERKFMYLLRHAEEFGYRAPADLQAPESLKQAPHAAKTPDEPGAKAAEG